MSDNLIVKEKGLHICSAQSDSVGSLQFDKRVKSRSYSSQFTLDDQILVSVDRREQFRPIEDIVIVEVDLSIGICKDVKSPSWKLSNTFQLDEMANQNPWVKKMITYDTFVDKDVLNSIRDEAMEPNKLYLMKHRHKQTTETTVGSSVPRMKPLKTVAVQFNPMETNKIMDVDKFVYPSNENNTVNVYLKLKNQVLRNELIINTGNVKHNHPEIENQYFSTVFMDFSKNKLSNFDDDSMYISKDRENPVEYKKRKDHDSIIIEPVPKKKENVKEIIKSVNGKNKNTNREVEDIPFVEETNANNLDHINDNRNTISKSLQYFLPAFDVSEINQESKEELDFQPVNYDSRGEVTTDDNDSSISITEKDYHLERDELESLNADDFDESIMDEFNQTLNEVLIEEESKTSTLSKNLYDSENLSYLDDIICQENLVLQVQQDQEDMVSEDEVERYMIDTVIDVPNDIKKYSLPKETHSSGNTILPEIKSVESQPLMDMTNAKYDQNSKKDTADKQKGIQPTKVSPRKEDKIASVFDFNKISTSSVPYRTIGVMRDDKPVTSLYSDRKEKFLNSNFNSSLQFFKQISDDRRSPVNSRSSSPISSENTESSQKNEFSTNSSDNSMIIKDGSEHDDHIFSACAKNLCEVVNEESEEETEPIDDGDSNPVFSNHSKTKEISNLQKSNSISDNISVYSTSTTSTVNEIIMTNLVKKPIDSTPGSFEEFLKNREIRKNSEQNKPDADSNYTEDTSSSSSDSSKVNPILRQGESIEDIAKYFMFPKDDQKNLKRSLGFDSKLDVLYNEEKNEENLLYPNKYYNRNFSPSSDDNTSLKVFHDNYDENQNLISEPERITKDSNVSILNKENSGTANSSDSEHTIHISDNQSFDNKGDVLEEKENVSTSNLYNKQSSLPNFGHHETSSFSDTDDSTSSENLPRRKIIVPVSKDKEKVKIRVIQPKIVPMSRRSISTLESNHSAKSIYSSENNFSLNNVKNSSLKSISSHKSSGSLPTSTENSHLQKNETTTTVSTTVNVNKGESRSSTNASYTNQKTLFINRQGISLPNSNLVNNEYNSTSTEESLSERESKRPNSKSDNKKDTEQKVINTKKIERKSLSSNNSNSSRSISTSTDEFYPTNKLQSKPPIYIDRQEKIMTTKSLEKKTAQLPLIICVSPPTTTSREELSSKNDLWSIDKECDIKDKDIEEKENLSDSSENSSFSTSTDELHSKSDHTPNKSVDRIENINIIQTHSQTQKTTRNDSFSSFSDTDSTESSMLSKEDSVKNGMIPQSEHREKECVDKIPQYMKKKKNFPVIEKEESSLIKNQKITESHSRPLSRDSKVKGLSIDRREKFTNLTKYDLKADIKRSISVPQYFELATNDPVLSDRGKQANAFPTSKSMNNMLDNSPATRHSKSLSYELISVVIKENVITRFIENRKKYVDQYFKDEAANNSSKFWESVKYKEASDSSSDYSISTSDDDESHNKNNNKPKGIIVTKEELIIGKNTDKEKNEFNSNENITSKNHHVERNVNNLDENNSHLTKKGDQQFRKNRVGESESETISLSTSSLDQITSESDDDIKMEAKFIDRQEKILSEENNSYQKITSSGQNKIISDSTDEDISFSLTSLADDNLEYLHVGNENAMNRESIKKEVISKQENIENTEITISLNSSSSILVKNKRIKKSKQANLISRSSQTLPMKKIPKIITSREKSKSLEKPLTQMNIIPFSYSMPGSLGDIVESSYHEYTETWSRQSPIESNIVKKHFKTDQFNQKHRKQISNTNSIKKMTFTQPLTTRPRPVPSYLSPVNAFPYIPSDHEFSSNDSIVDDYSADCNEKEVVTKYKSLSEFVSSLSNSSLPRASSQTRIPNKKVTSKKKLHPETVNLNYGAIENKRSESDKRKVSLTSVTTDSSYLERPILKDKKHFNHCASPDSWNSFSNGSSNRNLTPQYVNITSTTPANHKHCSSTSSSSDTDTEVGVKPNFLSQKSTPQIYQLQHNGKNQPYSKNNINNNQEKHFQHSKSLPTKQISSSSESSEFSSTSENDSNLYHF